jgi:cyanophycin synthetase
MLNNPLIGGSNDVVSMRVLESAVYHGLCLFGSLPMTRIQLDLGTLEEWPSNRLPGSTDRLLTLLPGLQEHGCCFRTPGGFVRRLHEGTWLGHIAEHVALQLQTSVGSRVTRGKTRSVRGQAGVYNVLFAFQEDKVGLLAGRYALELVDSLLPPELQGIRNLDRITEAEPFGGHRILPECRTGTAKPLGSAYRTWPHHPLACPRGGATEHPRSADR